MPRVVLTCCLIVALTVLQAPGPAAGQAGSAPERSWRLQAPLPTRNELYAVDMISPTQGWAVGASGTILRTTDGKTWSQQQSGTLEPIYTVTFKDSLHGWAGTNNTILYTTNGGATWKKGSGVVGGVYGIGFATLTSGFSAWFGEGMWKTTNGGVTWTQIQVPLAVTRIQFFDANNGVASGTGGVLHTFDGGVHWTPVPGTHGGFFVDHDEGWFLNHDEAEHTVDGGETWEPQNLPPGAWIYSGASFADRMNGWAVGESGTIVHTANGGRTWASQNAGPDRLYGVDAVDPLHAVAVGQGPAILATSDGGATWVSHVNGPMTIVYDMDATDGLHAWAAEAFGQILFTHDGGQQWNRRFAGSPFGHFWGIDCLPDNRNCWAVGDADQSNNTGMIYHSADGGQSWTLQFRGSFGDLAIIYDVAAVNSKVVVAVGAFGIYRTVDGGQNWHHTPSTLLSGVTFIGTTGYAVGNSGLILKSTNSGQTWVRQPQDVYPGSLMATSFSDPSRGWAVGFDSTVLRTVNGGQTWLDSSQGVPDDVNVLAVQAMSSDTAWIGGGPTGGYIARTSNGGQTWLRERLPGDPFAVSGLAFITEDFGWAGGHWGIWIRPPRCNDPRCLAPR